MNDKWFLSTTDEGVSTSKNLHCSKTRSPARTKRKRTNAEIDELNNPEKKGTVDETFGVGFDLKPRWRRASVPDFKQCSSAVSTGRIASRTQGECRAPDIILKDSVIDDARDAQSHQNPKTPTFRRTATHPHKEEVHGDSPACVVSGPDSYDNLYLCHRSLAWSDDEWSEDESIDHEAKSCAFVKPREDVLPYRHLFADRAREAHRSTEFICPTQVVGKHYLDGQPLAVSWHQYPDSPQNTSEIFWEEKVLDVLDLERMARLSI